MEHMTERTDDMKNLTDAEILKRAEQIEVRDRNLRMLKRALEADELKVAFGDRFSWRREMSTVSVSRFMLEAAIRAEISRLEDPTRPTPIPKVLRADAQKEKAHD